MSNLTLDILDNITSNLHNKLADVKNLLWYSKGTVDDTNEITNYPAIFIQKINITSSENDHRCYKYVVVFRDDCFEIYTNTPYWVKNTEIDYRFIDKAETIIRELITGKSLINIDQLGYWAMV